MIRNPRPSSIAWSQPAARWRRLALAVAMSALAGTMLLASAAPAQPTPVAPALLDVDASETVTQCDALTDGLLIIRYLFGLSGPSLTVNALGPTATRTDPDAIKGYLDGIRNSLDVDGNGTADGLTDGLLIIRYLFGLRGEALIANALDPQATRTSAEGVEAYVQTMMTPEQPASLQTKVVAVQFPPLDDRGISLEGLTVSTLFSERTMGEGETVADMGFVDADKGQILFVSDAEGTPFLVAYLTASEIAAGASAITVDAIARGLIMTNPLLLGFGRSERLAILAYAESDPRFEELKGKIDYVLDTQPRDLLDEAAFPQIYQDAVALVIDAIQNAAPAAGQQFKGARAALGLTPVVGIDSAPFLGDVPGASILTVNPTHLFYGVDISGRPAQVVAGKASWWELKFAWPPVGIPTPVTEEVWLGDGSFTISFVKFGVGTRAKLMAGGANLLRIGCDLIDLVAFCPASNALIEKYVESSDELDILAQALSDIIEGKVERIPKVLIEKVSEALLKPEVWRSFTKSIYRNAADKELAVLFLKSSKALLKKVSGALVVYDAANVVAPFVWDMLIKPDELRFCATQTGGVLTGTCQMIPPVAVIDKLSPVAAQVGGVVSFSASRSFDDRTAASALPVRWDFDGDGSFDTGWSTVKQANWTYDAPGVYTVALEVKDGDGLVGREVYDLVVGLHDTITTVDGAGDVGQNSSIAVGVDGLPVISYHDYTNHTLKVAKCANAACSGASTLTTLSSPGAGGQHSSLAIPSDGRPVISYSGWIGTNRVLRVAKCGNASCTDGNTIATVDSTGNVGQYTSIAISGDGLPVISYYDDTNDALKVAKCANAACSATSVVRTVDSAQSSGRESSSIATGRDGNPIIAYHSYNSLKVAKCSRADCAGSTTITLENPGYPLGMHPSIAIGPDGLPVIASRDNGYGGVIKVAKCSDTACTGTSSNTIVDSGDWPSLRFGSDRLPVISYYDTVAGTLKVARCSDDACQLIWTAPTVDTVGAVGWGGTSVALGADGLPVISYRNFNNADLKVVKCGTPSCLP